MHCSELSLFPQLEQNRGLTGGGVAVKAGVGEATVELLVGSGSSGMGSEANCGCSFFSGRLGGA